MKYVTRFFALCFCSIAMLACSESAEQDGSPDSALLRIAIPVRDIDSSKRFYSDVLGFESGFDGDITSPWVTRLLQLDDGQTVRFAILNSAENIAAGAGHGAMIGLLQVDNPALPPLQRPEGSSLVSGEGILAMITSDVESVYTRLQEFDTRILFGPSRSADGSEIELVFYDPDGIRVHVVQRIE